MKLNKHKSLGLKNEVEYFQDDNGIIFCEALNQDSMIGGTAEEERNSMHNGLRILRINHIKQNAKVLDFGCGSGILVKYLNDSGITCVGYDKFNPNYNKLPKKEHFDIVTMIEVIEHLSEPFAELDLIYKSLVKGGKVMIETSFTDWLNLECDYINPQIGHSTIFSHKGLTELMKSKGFIEGVHFNRNVRIYTKH
jgi:cyclopropane fatty-acyl-phospholipid synthase-like methyltransferase